MTERESRDLGRAQVREVHERKEEIQKLITRLKRLADARRSTTDNFDEMFNIRLNLKALLIKDGMTSQEAGQYIEKLENERYDRSGFGQTFVSTMKKRTVAKHSMSHDEFYSAVQDYKDGEAVEHYGILGMKWGIRRYQNPDGSLTALGKKHQEDGKTQAAIDKFNQKKETAIAKGNKKFVEKHLDYMSNYDIQRFNERLKSRNSIESLKKDAQKITAEKLQNWSTTASTIFNKVANMSEDGVRLYNTVVKINNTFSKNKWKPIKGESNEENVWVKKVVKYKDEQGRDITESYNEKKK